MRPDYSNETKRSTYPVYLPLILPILKERKKLKLNCDSRIDRDSAGLRGPKK